MPIIRDSRQRSVLQPKFTAFSAPVRTNVYGSLQAYEETGDYLETGDYQTTDGIVDTIMQYKLPLLIAGGVAALWYAKKKRMF